HLPWLSGERWHSYNVGAVSRKCRPRKTSLIGETAMLFAVLEMTDFALLALLLLIFTGGARLTQLGPLELTRLALLEQKHDLLLAPDGVAYTPPKVAWQALADKGPDYKIAAIKACREANGSGLSVAKQAVEIYLASSSHNAGPIAAPAKETS